MHSGNGAADALANAQRKEMPVYTGHTDMGLAEEVGLPAAEGWMCEWV